MGLELLPHLGMPVVGREQVFEHVPRLSDHAKIGLREGGPANHLPAGDEAAGFEHPFPLGQHGARVRDVHEHVVVVDDVEEAVIEGKVNHVANVEDRVIPTLRRGDRPRQVDLRLLHVDAVQLTGIDGLGQPHRDGAGSAAEVEQAQAGPEIWQQVRGVGRRRIALHGLQHLLAESHGVVGCRGCFNSCHRVTVLSPVVGYPP